MTTRWITVCDASRARVFEVKENDTEWQLIHELDHPGARAHGRDLTTDKPGSVQQIGSPSGVAPNMEPPTDPKEVEAQAFARILDEELTRGFDEHRFSTATLIAPPRFLGLLRKTLSDRVLKAVDQSYDLDYTKLKVDEIQTKLAKRQG